MKEVGYTGGGVVRATVPASWVYAIAVLVAPADDVVTQGVWNDEPVRCYVSCLLEQHICDTRVEVALFWYADIFGFVHLLTAIFIRLLKHLHLAVPERFQ